MMFSMLQQLTIQNFGLVDRISLEFDGGLNILTGETGAGKSILIDALRSVLGERMDTSSIRQPQNPAVIEAVLDITDPQLASHVLVSEFLTPEDSTLIIQRSHSSDGKSKVKINGQAVTVGQLKALGNLLIDFHGPHDHQLLFAEEQHLKILDQLADFKNLKSDYKTVYESFAGISADLKKLQDLAQTRQRDLDLLTHQVKELERVPLSEEKFMALEQEQTKLNNAEKLHEHIQAALNYLEDSENGADTLLRKAFSPIKSLAHIDEHAGSFLDELSLMQEQLSDLTAKLTDYGNSLEFDAGAAEKIRDTYDAYVDIKRKYGPGLDDAAQLYTELKSKLDLIKDFEHNDAHLRGRLQALTKDLAVIAEKMTKLRKKTAASLKATIETELKELGISHVQFEVRFEQIPFNPQGHDHAAFFISPNAGEDLKPLAQIVSSGEAARVMLALKKALIKADPVPVLIFDEIDAQIGGRLGTITGKKLKELSEHRQVILITHLPQIASFADKHFKVVKSVKSGRATTEVQNLDKKERVDEIAQMMSGRDVTKTSLSHAQDMLAVGQRKS